MPSPEEYRERILEIDQRIRWLQQGRLDNYDPRGREMEIQMLRQEKAALMSRYQRNIRRY